MSIAYFYRFIFLTARIFFCITESVISEITVTKSIV